MYMKRKQTKIFYIDVLIWHEISDSTTIMRYRLFFFRRTHLLHHLTKKMTFFTWHFQENVNKKSEM